MSDEGLLTTWSVLSVVQEEPFSDFGFSGTNFVSQADTLKHPFNCLGLITYMVSGQPFGQWEILDVQVMVRLWKDWYVKAM